MRKTDRLWFPQIVFCLGAIASCIPVFAEEGMWTFDNPPIQQIREKYGFTLTREWLDHVRLSSVRFSDGGSGSFVSARGLILTNHHVALGQLQKVSTPDRDYVKTGFYARNEGDEIRCPDLELNVLMSMEDVTRRVQGVVKTGMSESAVYRARREEMARIEKESLNSTGLRSDVVTLYSGGEYWLYRYKKYTDVRLVFAPEEQIAFFGGDPDNFTYPRYDLDMALFRAYENGKPVESRHFLKWNSSDAREADLVFVSGNPGATDRLSTIAQLEAERDAGLPTRIKQIRRRLEVLRRYAAKGQEQAREATSQMRRLENSLKVLRGEYNGLLDKTRIEKKWKEESEFRARIAANPVLEARYGNAWDAIAAAEKTELSRFNETTFRSLRGSRITSLAATIVQYVAEIHKPDGERLDGFHDSQLDSLRFRILSPAPIYPGMETVLLADSLEESLEHLGPEDVYMIAALNGRTPAAAARETMAGTKLSDPAYRKALMEGGQAAVDASDDPAIVMARRVDPMARELVKWVEDNVESVLATAGEKIGQARFAIYGKSVYPDATFTLRLSYGSVKGYPMNGTEAPPRTTFFGLYDRSNGFDGKPPFDLPARYTQRRDKLDLSKSLNFVCTCDTIGGNSGSPVVNKKGEIVGVIFDGNIESLVGRYVYNDEDNRSVAVATAGMIEALRRLYDGGKLADELETK